MEYNDPYEVKAPQIYLNGNNLQLSNVTAGESVFTTTGTTKEVTIVGALATDIYIVSGKYVGGVDQQDVLQWTAGAGSLTVTRLAAGESAAAFSWLRISQ